MFVLYNHHHCPSVIWMFCFAFFFFPHFGFLKVGHYTDSGYFLAQDNLALASQMLGLQDWFIISIFNRVLNLLRIGTRNACF